MAKVRVPQKDRPPTRFGIIRGKKGMYAEGKRFRLTGHYRPPKDDEWYWNPHFQSVWYAAYNHEYPRVILEEVKG
jgi:hypothetical protein